VRVEDHGTWERPFPVRFVLTCESEALESEEEIYLGRCAAVEGLFVDRPPARREILTFRNCAPGAVLGPLGQAYVEGWALDRPVRWWELDDAEILAVVPKPSGIVDVGRRSRCCRSCAGRASGVRPGPGCGRWMTTGE
jgi:hypothetical protein